MIAQEQRYALRWKYAHRMDATIVDLRADYLIADVDHRCKPYCYLLREQPATLVLSGRRAFFYQFETMFELIPDGAIPLPSAP